MIRRFEDALAKAAGRRPLSAEERRIERLRALGVKIGQGCLIYTDGFSTEPYLIEIGDHVGIAKGTEFVTHEPALWLVRDRYPNAQVFGRIVVGSNTFIGINCVILPNTTIGRGCIVGAATVVRGLVPDDSVAYGNPARVIRGKAAFLAQQLLRDRNRLDARSLSAAERMRLLLAHFGLPPPESP
ncbi:MAG: acyltransferase [Bryobacteraceae bacterium]|nr:acyltransferase [Bryobacteraceae bacterium]